MPIDQSSLTHYRKHCFHRPTKFLASGESLGSIRPIRSRFYRPIKYRSHLPTKSRFHRPINNISYGQIESCCCRPIRSRSDRPIKSRSYGSCSSFLQTNQISVLSIVDSLTLTHAGLSNKPIPAPCSHRAVIACAQRATVHRHNHTGARCSQMKHSTQHGRHETLPTTGQKVHG